MAIMAKIASKLHNNKELSDCSFAIGPSRVIYAQKAILAAASPVFKAMLYGSMKETKYPIDIHHVEIETFQNMLTYIYNGTITCENYTDYLQLWEVSERFLIPELSQTCTEKLLGLIKVRNVWMIWSQATLFDSVSLEKKCTEIVSSYTSIALSRDEFVHIDLNLLLKTLNIKYLNICEINLFYAVEKWAKCQCTRAKLEITTSNLRNVSKDAVKLIKFLSMPAKDFICGPALSPLLTPDEIHSITVNMHCKNAIGKLIVYPSGFSASIKKCRHILSEPKLLMCHLGLNQWVNLTDTDKTYQFSLRVNSNAELNRVGALSCRIYLYSENSHACILLDQAVAPVKTNPWCILNNAYLERGRQYIIEGIFNRHTHLWKQELVDKSGNATIILSESPKFARTPSVYPAY